MTETLLAAIVGAAVGAVVAGLFSLVFTVPQIRLMRASLRAQITQSQMPVLQPALMAAGPLFLRRYTSNPPDDETLRELTHRWNMASESLVMALPRNLGREIDDLVSTYIHVLHSARAGNMTAEAIDESRLETIAIINALVGIPI